MNRGQRQDAIVDDDYDRKLRQVAKANNEYLRCDPFAFSRNEVENLTFRDRFDILMEIRLSGVAKRLIWGISGR